MKYLLALTFANFILSATSFDIDATDDGTIEYFLSELFNLEEPEKYELVKSEVQQHADELLAGLFTLIGEGFEFERDMKEKFNQEFEMEKLQKVIEDIFGIESEIASQLHKNSAEVKQNILDLIDSFVGGSSGRAKRASGNSEPKEGAIETLKKTIDDSKDKLDSHKSNDNEANKDTKKKIDHRIIPNDSEGNLDIEDDKVDDIDDHKDKDDHDDEDENNLKQSKSDDASDEKDNDDSSSNLERFKENIEHFSDSVREAAEDRLHLKADKHATVVNYTTEDLKKRRKIFRKLSDDTIDFMKEYIDQLVDIFRTFASGIRR